MRKMVSTHGLALAELCVSDCLDMHLTASAEKCHKAGDMARVDILTKRDASGRGAPSIGAPSIVHHDVRRVLEMRAPAVWRIAR
jgi:hypothetical protein